MIMTIDDGGRPAAATGLPASAMIPVHAVNRAFLRLRHTRAPGGDKKGGVPDGLGFA